MSSQLTETTTAILLTNSNLVEEYSMERQDLYFKHGTIFDRLFMPSEQLVTSDGVRMPLFTGPMDTWRANDELLGDVADNEAPLSDKLHYRLSATNPAANDFSEVSGSAQVSDIDLELQGRSIDAAVADFVPKVLMQMDQGQGEAFYRLMNIPRSGQMGLVSGTKKNADSKQMSSATTYTAGSSSARFTVDNGAIGLFRRNMHIDIKSAAGAAQATHVRITDVNTVDSSIAVALTAKSAEANLNSIADNGVITLSRESGKAFKGSLPEWFPTSVTAGENWIEGRDRTLPANYYLLPVRTRIGEASAKINMDMFTAASRAAHYQGHGAESVNVALMNTDLSDAFVKLAGDKAQVQAGTDEGNFSLGGIGVTLQTPHLGRVRVVGDPGVTPNTIYGLDLTTWRRLNLYQGGVKYLPGTYGIWTRLPASNGRGGSKFYRAEAYGIMTTACIFPEKNFSIHNVTAN